MEFKELVTMVENIFSPFEEIKIDFDDESETVSVYGIFYPMTFLWDKDKVFFIIEEDGHFNYEENITYLKTEQEIREFLKDRFSTWANLTEREIKGLTKYVEMLEKEFILDKDDELEYQLEQAKSFITYMHNLQPFLSRFY